MNAARARRINALTGSLVVLCATAISTVGSVRTARAETYVPSASQSFVLTGHGLGHGRGMSQWGAYGMATEGQTAQQILDFYYPGTQTTVLQPDPSIRVWLTADEGVDVEVVAALGNESVTDLTTNAVLALPATVAGAAVTDWKAARTLGGTTQLWGFWQGAWQPYPTTGQLSTNDILRFSSDAPTMRLVLPDQTQRAYEGFLDAVQVGTALRTVNTVGLEAYLKGVVPHEAINSWPAAALQAQAVAARSYAAEHLGGSPDDLCDSASCQVYLGVASYSPTGVLTANLQFPESNAAVAAVAGQVRTVNGLPVITEYSSSDGGFTVSTGVAWEPAQADPFDHYSPYHDWTQTLTSAAIEGAYPAVGSLSSMTVTQRDGNGDWGGRVLSLTLSGSAGDVTVSGTDFRTAMGLKSSWWTVGGASEGGGYLHPIVPARILDTRVNGGRFGAGQTRSIPVAGLGGVPADAVGVALNVTATDTTTSSYLTVWPLPAAKPATSNLNWDRAGQTVANLVYTGLDASGSVQIYNNLGAASVVVDVFGYFEPAQIAGGLGFVAVTPDRVLDTRNAIGAKTAPIAAGTSRTVTVAGTPGVDSTAQAVVVNLTGTRPTANTYLTLWPTGVAQPGTSNLNLLPGETRANAAVALLGGGAVSLYNNRGNSDAIVDVLGEYIPGDGVTGEFVSVQPSRLLDTRTAAGGHSQPMTVGQTRPLQVLGHGGVPTSGVAAVVLNVTAVAPTAQTYVTVWRSGIGRPLASNLNAPRGAVVPNLVISQVGSDGAVDLYNDAGSTGLVVDVMGWISG